MRTFYDPVSGFAMPVVNGADIGSSLIAMNWTFVLLAGLTLAWFLWRGATSERSNARR
jgi:hypothetical protein